jgi:hypothetical protein
MALGQLEFTAMALEPRRLSFCELAGHAALRLPACESGARQADGLHLRSRSYLGRVTTSETRAGKTTKLGFSPRSEIGFHSPSPRHWLVLDMLEPRLGSAEALGARTTQIAEIPEDLSPLRMALH